MSAPARHERRKYSASQLMLVLCQVRFPVLHRFEDASFLAAVQDALRDRYPRARQEQQLAVVVGPGGPVQAPGATLWRYHDLDEAWSVVLQRDSAGLETTQYDRFEPFLERLVELVDVLRDAGIEVTERIGLRYINNLRHPKAKRPADWQPLLNEKLLGIVGGDQLEGAEIFQAIQEIRLTRTDGTFVLRHGYVGGEAAQNEPYYLVDLDYFDERAKILDRSEIEAQLQDYHEEISRVWEMSLEDPMRQELQDEGAIDDER
jgi:uncharacterized protein (TIGR04255 family)